MLQPRDRRVCPLCRSKPIHAPMRVQLLAHSLSRAVAALPVRDRKRYQERSTVAGAYQEEVRNYSSVTAFYEMMKLLAVVSCTYS